MKHFVRRFCTVAIKQFRRKVARLFRNMAPDEKVQDTLNRNRALHGEEPIILKFTRSERKETG